LANVSILGEIGRGREIDEYIRSEASLVDVDTGLVRDLRAMLEWCRARVPRPAWAYYGHT
jgi:hypothetical protein